MLLTALALRNFRCHRSLRIRFDHPATWITGKNGTGKTSLIEAIHYLSRLKSHLTASTNDLISHGESQFTIQAQLADANKIRIEKTPRTRELFFNEAKSTLEEFYASVPVVLFCSQDINIIREGGSVRRAYLNMLLAQIMRPLIGDMLTYKRILLQRSAEIRKKRPHKSTLEILTTQLVKTGEPLQQARIELAATLAVYASLFHKHISGSREKLKIKIYPAPWQSDLNNEIKQQRNLIGWQRDTVEIFINGRPANKFASEGQQRTAALALRAAEFVMLRRHNRYLPLVLVDDVLGELDTARRRALTTLLDPGCQTIITSTQEDPSILPSNIEKPDIIRLENTHAQDNPHYPPDD